MELEKVNFEQAKALRKIGFPQICGYMSDVYTEDGRCCYINVPQTPDCELYEAPSLELAAKWLRDEKGIYVWVRPEFWAHNGVHKVTFTHILSKLGNAYIDTGEENEDVLHNTWNEALSAGINKAIELLMEEEE